MTQAQLLKLAKQGNTQAIAFLMNRHLRPKGITAKVILKDSCLQVMLESEQVPNQQVLAAFIHKGITKLGAVSIEKVKVYGRQTSEELPAWSEEFQLGAVEDEEFADTPHILTISITLSGDTECGLTAQNFENIANKMTSDIFASCHDVFIQKVSVINGSSIVTKER